jgi:hypothetical protein
MAEHLASKEFMGAIFRQRARRGKPGWGIARNSGCWLPPGPPIALDNQGRPWQRNPSTNRHEYLLYQSDRENALAGQPLPGGGLLA